jgi:hypothetical protein
MSSTVAGSSTVAVLDAEHDNNAQRRWLDVGRHLYGPCQMTNEGVSYGCTAGSTVQSSTPAVGKTELRRNTTDYRRTECFVQMSRYPGFGSR